MHFYFLDVCVYLSSFRFPPAFVSEHTLPKIMIPDDLIDFVSVRVHRDTQKTGEASLI